MASTPTTHVLPRTFTVEGYVHKFRFESEPVAVVREPPTIEVESSESQVAPAAEERRLVLAFLATVVGLSALLLAIVTIVQS